jgi:hypothetical protein
MVTRVKLLEDIDGAKAGEVTFYQDDALAAKLIADGKAEPAPLKPDQEG